MNAAIQLPKDIITEFCKRNRIRSLALFGSALREDFQPGKSDIDLLVEFEPDAIPGLFKIAGMELDLTDALGVKVDLQTKEDLSKYFRDKVVKSAKLIYSKGKMYEFH